ncbi:unnamed protein product [Dicrocoelium dendriticum]|nr:unnamed protein product [Dicrocoelium dendriticum]
MITYCFPEAVIGDWNANIRIVMGIVGDDLTGEWRSVYGSANEVLHIAETACLKYDEMANTVKLPGYKNFTCVVTGPDRGYLKADFMMQLESDEVDTNTLTKGDFEKRNTGIGYELTNLQLIPIIAPR